MPDMMACDVTVEGRFGRYRRNESNWETRILVLSSPISSCRPAVWALSSCSLDSRSATRARLDRRAERAPVGVGARRAWRAEVAQSSGLRLPTIGRRFSGLWARSGGSQRSVPLFNFCPADLRNLKDNTFDSPERTGPAYEAGQLVAPPSPAAPSPSASSVSTASSACCPQPPCAAKTVPRPLSLMARACKLVGLKGQLDNT